MSLERILAETLKDAGRFTPSPDLFARVNRSIDEDRDHRRRLGIFTASGLVAVLAVVGFLGAVTQRSSTGVWLVPRWSLEVVEGVFLVALLLILGPSVRRFGRPLIKGVFHLEPSTGLHFSRLLDIAYYLVFSGVILARFDLASPTSLVRISIGLSDSLTRVASFLLMMGVAHVVNLAVLPVVGLMHSSLVRRARRHTAGTNAPPLAIGAVSAERVAAAFILVLVGVLVAGTLVVVGLVLVGGFLVDAPGG